jgi:hypothetical protein
MRLCELSITSFFCHDFQKILTSLISIDTENISLDVLLTGFSPFWLHKLQYKQLIA